jgi:hypothetical protein
MFCMISAESVPFSQPTNEDFRHSLRFRVTLRRFPGARHRQIDAALRDYPLSTG